MKRIVCLLLIIAVVISSVAVLAACDNGSENVDKPDGYDFAAHSDLYDAVISSQVTYIRSLQLENGAICKWSVGHQSQVICPYFSCFAALALLEQDTEDCTADAKEYIDWHFSKLNATPDVNGVAYTIYDYNVSTDLSDPEHPQSVLTSTNSYDSTDSYAALFLVLLNRYREVSGDTAYLSAHAAQIAGVYDAMLFTYDEDDKLTGAKPDFTTRYLMDSSEVYAGCEAAAELFAALGNSEKKADAEAKTAAIKEGIEGLYRENLGVFSPHASVFGANKNTFYPDMAAQLYPVTFGVFENTDELAVSAYGEFKQKFGTVDTYEAGDSFPWMIGAYAAYQYGDYDFAIDLLDYANTEYIQQQNAYPWYSMEGAMALLTASKMKAQTK